MLYTRKFTDNLIRIGIRIGMLVVFFPLFMGGNSAVLAESPLVKTWEAHGGISNWRKQQTFTYTLNGFPLSAPMAKPNVSTVDLVNRYNKIEGQGFTVGFDGNEAWALPSREAVGLPPRFVALGSFYFVGMPFVFGDPGVVLKERGTAMFRGEKYRVVSANYGAKVGFTSKDDYILYINPDTHVLKLINHSVTEPSNKAERVAWVFNEWQRVSNLLIPKRMTFYGGWKDGKPLEPGKSCTIENATFRTIAPDPKIYARPANAVIDTSPVY